MQIGELASRAGVNVQTIRFYEREALLPQPARNASGYRSYSQADLERVTFIKRNQEIGFTLTEIRQLIQLHGSMSARPKGGRRKPHEVLAIVGIGRERLRAIDEKVRMLLEMRTQLISVVSQLENMSETFCPVSSPSAAQPHKLEQTLSSGCPEQKNARSSELNCPVAGLPKSPKKHLPKSS